ncbi:hypothetical protein BD309DRAFT_985020, partial [Dichomitus squalens]
MPLVSSFSSPGFCVNSADELLGLSVKLTAKPSRGAAIQDLRIVLHTPFSLEALHQCLILMPNITDLVVLLSEPDVPGLLDAVRLPKIEFFRTNAYHHLLTDFLASHTTISILQLAQCGEDDDLCPLVVVDLQVQCIGGPAKCVSHLAHDGVSRLMMASSDRARTPSLLLRSIHPHLASLYTLTMDFYPDEHDVLSSIITVCKTVRKLKLIEQPSSQ